MAGVDIVEDRDWFDRIYQVYVVAILGVCLFMGWAAVLDVVGGAFVATGPVVAGTVAGATILLLPFVMFALAALGALRQPAFKLTTPDVAFVANGVFDTRAIALVNAFPHAATVTVLCALVAFLALDGAAEAVAGLAGLSWRDSMALAIAVGFASAAVAELGRGVGYVRLRLGLRSFACRAAFAVGVLALVICVLAGGLSLTVAYASSLFPTVVASVSSLSVMVVASLFALVFIITVVCLVFARDLDLACAIEESGAYAALYGVRHLAFGAPDVYRELRRRYRISHRRLRPTISLAPGSLAPVARALQTYLRQFEGLPRLAFVGAVLCPASAFMLTAKIPPFLLFSYVYLLFVSVSAIRELSLAFRADQGIRLVRDALPFNTLRLAMLDGLPATAFVLALSLLVTGPLAALLPGLLSPSAIILVVLFPLFLSLAAALDGIEFSRSARRLSSGMAVLIVAIATACSSLWLPDALILVLMAAILYLLYTLAHSA